MTFVPRRALIACLAVLQLCWTIGGVAHHAPAGSGSLHPERRVEADAPLWEVSAATTSDGADCPLCAFLALTPLLPDVPPETRRTVEARTVEPSYLATESFSRPGPPCRAPPASLSRS